MNYDIEFHNVSFQYEGSKTFALKDINLNISQGEILLITGPAGSGKTTLCSCVNGLVPHYHEGQLSGEVLVRSNNTKRARIGSLASLVGMVFQDPESQLVTASVVDEVAFGPENFGVPRQEINRRIDEALQATRLEGYQDRDPHSLSGGEQQACVIAAIYAMHPEIYIMDEPLANLDPVGRAQVMKVVVDIAKQRGKTLVIVEHSLEEVLPLVDRIIVLNQGQIIRDGTVDEVLAQGDIARIFTRPTIVQLASQYGLQPLPLTAEGFLRAFKSKFMLGHIQSNNFEIRDNKPGKPLVEIENVSYSYDGNQAALDGVSLSVHEGDLIAILGRNGSGKTTLVRHIIGLLQPKDGKVEVMGKDVSVTPTHELAQDVGFCFQNPNHQLVSFKVKDEMLFGLIAHHIDPTIYEERIHEALEFVDLLDYVEAEVFDLGKGQKQRLALASVLTLKPRILIIDEPTTGQDPKMTDEIFEMIKLLNEQGTTVLMITHKVDYAAVYANRVIVLNRGRIVFDGNPRALLNDHQLLITNSLDLPEPTKLAYQLQEYGVPQHLVTKSEIEQALNQLIEVKHDN